MSNLTPLEQELLDSLREILEAYMYMMNLWVSGGTPEDIIDDKFSDSGARAVQAIAFAEAKIYGGIEIG